jgi:hypothetical protein
VEAFRAIQEGNIWVYCRLSECSGSYVGQCIYYLVFLGGILALSPGVVNVEFSSFPILAFMMCSYDSF